MVDLAGFVKLDFYRFIMIFGFVIFAFFLIVPEYFQYKIYSQKIQREASVELISLEYERVDHDIAVDKAKVEAKLNEYEQLTPSQEQLNELKVVIDESEKENMDNLMMIREKLQTFKVDETMEKYVENRYWRYFVFQWLGIFIGLSMMFFGLYRWYMIQNLLDRKLAQSLNEIRNQQQTPASGNENANRGQ